MRSPLARVNGHRTRPAPSAGSWFALATIVLAGSLFVLNNLGPYLGLPYSGAMTMFSGLAQGAANHFFMPHIPLGDGGTFVTVVRVDGPAAETRPGRMFKALGDSARQRGQVLTLNVIRYHSSRACAAAERPELQLHLRTTDGRAIEYANVCEEPRELQYSMLPGVPTCGSGCDNFRHFARSDEFRR